ncbi:MAG: short-chain dehydrogenase, partial [Rhodococcus sp. (in: high G+C Gram-positive bacteria)]
AREGLEHITDGPVWVAGGHYETAKSWSGFTRGAIVEKAAIGMRKLLNRS